MEEYKLRFVGENQQNKKFLGILSVLEYLFGKVCVIKR